MRRVRGRGAMNLDREEGELCKASPRVHVPMYFGGLKSLKAPNIGTALRATHTESI